MIAMAATQQPARLYSPWNPIGWYVSAARVYDRFMERYTPTEQQQWRIFGSITSITLLANMLVWFAINALCFGDLSLQPIPDLVDLAFFASATATLAGATLYYALFKRNWLLVLLFLALTACGAAMCSMFLGHAPLTP